MEKSFADMVFSIMPACFAPRQNHRFLIDSRDTETDSRLEGLSDAFSVFRCHSIMNCVSVCPKGLNPTRAIGHIKSMLLQRSA
jgi:succinate dehydrogenase / fumarate reductase iron-sulfur subunit